ncbi:MAG: T9SS type A sorting domain-containing protein [Muribaculum sp.]|nr:T9SS type A sorting domain-containing protein [Muribaculum sp.]
MNIRKLFAAIGILAIAMPVCADETPTALIISMTDGNRQTVELSECPVVKIEGENLVVKGSGTEINLELNKVKDFTYGSASGITVPGSSDTFVRQGDNLIVSSDGQPLDVVLTSVNGIILKAQTVASGESLTLSLTDLVTGVYIVTVNGVSSKIVKR